MTVTGALLALGALLIPLVAQPTPVAAQTDPGITVAEDAARGRRGLVDRNDAVNVFELSYSRSFTPRHGDALRLYHAFFLREPDIDGAKYWLDTVDRGVSLTVITDSFAESREFRNRYGTISDEEFIDLVYGNVLGRTPDVSGRAYWLDLLRRPDGITRAELMLYFSDSVEFENAHPYPVPIEPGGPAPELPVIRSGERTIDVAAYGIPTNRSNSQLTTDRLQQAIDDADAAGIGTIRLPAGHYLIGEPGNDIYRAGLQLPSRTAFVLDPGAILELAPHDKWNACLLAVTSKTDVIIRGGTLIGDRLGHVFTPRADGATAHDEGHSICVQSGSKRVLVDDVTIRNSTGDGILLVGNRSQGSVSDITISNSEFDNNRRQGISIVGAIRVDISNNEIHHTNGTSPQFGIDIESLSFTSRDISIARNYFHHNAGGDIVNTDGRNVLIEYNRFEEGDGLSADGSRPMRNLDGPLVTWPNADQVIRHNTFHVRNGSVNGKVGIIGYSRTSGRTDNPAPVIVHDNVCDGCGMYWYQTRQVHVYDNEIIDGYLVMRDVSDARIHNNEVSHSSRCWAYRFLRVTGSASGNTYGGEAFDIPLQQYIPYDGCWVR